MSRLGHTDRPTGVPLRYERDRPGELLHVDVKKIGRIPAGGGWRMLGRGTEARRRSEAARRKGRLGYDYLHAAVDDHSRVAYVEVHPDERGETCARFLASAAAFYASHGVRIEAVMTDNAMNYVSLGGLHRGPGVTGSPPPADPALPPPDQRQGGAVQPNHGRGVGLRPTVPIKRRAPARPPPVA